MRHTPLVLLISLLFFAIACTFMLDEPTGLTHGDNTIPPKDSISLASYEDVDTIYLSENKIFWYTITDNLGGYQFSANVHFDEVLIHTFSDRTGVFQIPDEKFYSGTHTLKLSLNETYTDKNLISQFSNRQSSIFRTWVVVIDNDPPPQFAITTSIENGYLKYSWPAYTKSDFLYYEVKGTMTDPQVAYVISDPSKSFVYDSTYIDGRYQSLVEITVVNTHGTSGATSGVNEPAVTFDLVFHPEDSTASLTWTKPKYFGNFKAYNISDGSGVLADVTTVDDLTKTVDINGVFPTVTQVFFRLKDKDDKEITKIEKDIDYFVGNTMTQSGTFNQYWYYSKSGNEYIGRNGNKITMYNDVFTPLRTRQIGGNAFYGMTVAWPGNYLHYVDGTYSITQYDCRTNNEHSLSIPGAHGPNAYVDVVFGADNQTVSFHSIDNDHEHPTTEIFGIGNVQTSTFEQASISSWSILSDDGRYSVQWPQVYSVSGNTQTNIGMIPDPYRFRWFRGDNTDEMITTEYNSQLTTELNTVIIRSSDMAILRSFPSPEAGFSLVTYDPSIKTLLYTRTGSDKVYVINIETGKQRVFNANGSSATGLANGNLIIGAHYIKIP